MKSRSSRAELLSSLDTLDDVLAGALSRNTVARRLERERTEEAFERLLSNPADEEPWMDLWLVGKASSVGHTGYVCDSKCYSSHLRNAVSPTKTNLYLTWPVGRAFHASGLRASMSEHRIVFFGSQTATVYDEFGYKESQYVRFKVKGILDSPSSVHVAKVIYLMLTDKWTAWAYDERRTG
jgi:hypothetical protein